MAIKETRKLFYGKYQYKITILSYGSSCFRSPDIKAALLRSFNLSLRNVTASVLTKRSELFEFSMRLENTLSALSDFKLRVESPYISFYTNNKSDLLLLRNLDPERVVDVFEPNSEITLEKDTIILPNVPFEYKVNISVIKSNYDEFIEWADTITNVRLTKSCRRGLSQGRLTCPVYFYVSGNNNLLLAKMHLGPIISKIERIVKA
jgi:hypothetical protein